MEWKELQAALAKQNYIASNELVVAIQLALSLERPLLLEGSAGVGKTELARALSQTRSTKLIRLQCYEGLDAAQSIYEWNYQRQLISIRAAADDGISREQIEKHVFSKDFLLERPLLMSITQKRSPVLLIDEIDRADEEFEAFLLEILSDYQVSIPELGTVSFVTKPIVVLTSNGTRDLSDALRRRCLYSYVEYPDRTTEIDILKVKQPNIDSKLAGQIIDFVQKLRKEDLEKTPGIAEMLDFSAALIGLGVNDLSHDPEILQSAMTTLLKTKSDQWNITTEVAQRLAGQAA
ncbi:MAG: AAA family ATPase [Paracoccaceae bacterium]|jgi:MoxR-like ATPase|tara:strand:- start:3157 stop:4032 length:876 start_codon:yes stop_codon:yes gene_type:complete